MNNSDLNVFAKALLAGFLAYAVALVGSCQTSTPKPWSTYERDAQELGYWKEGGQCGGEPGQ